MIDTIASVAQSAPAVSPGTVSAAVFDSFKSAPELIAIAVIDQHRPVGLINRHDLSAILATPYGRALYAGKPIALVMDPKPLIVPIELTIDRLEEIILSERPEALATGFILVRPDGSYAGIGSALSVLRSSVERTIRRNRELEQLRAQSDAANHAKSQFIAHMSHEIRTPMNAVIGLSRLALKRPLDSQLRDYLTKIYASAGMLLGIINDILDFSKIEAGKLTLESVAFDLDVVIDGVVSSTAVRASEKDIEFLISVPPEVPRSLVGDPLRLGQILLNLINNAVKFTDKGEVVVTVQVGVREVQAVELEFAVRDTGIGMTEQEQERLFRSFSQGDPSMSRRYGGTGLGLAISQALTDLMRGTIGATSKPRAGSTFRFSALFGLQPEQRELPVLPPELAGRRVLVLDDNAAARHFIAETLARWNLDPVLVGSGQAALDALAAAARSGKAFDLLLLDHKLPDMSAVEVARLIREKQPGSLRLPIVLLTAFGEEEVARQARRHGVKSSVAKPINPSTLLEAIQAALGQPRPKRASRRTETTQASGLALAGARILLVEDNEINCQIAVENLVAAGLLVEIATNGREAVEMVRARPGGYDAVLMDIQMPEMDGLEATRVIRSELGAEELPIIAMTAHALEEERRDCLAAGMNDHIPKPIDPGQMLRSLARWVRPEADAEALVAGAATETTAPSGLLPRDLSCFDIEAALERTNHNEGLMTMLLREFADQFAGSAESLRQAIDAQQLQDGERLVHTLAGVSGSLAADALESICRSLEQALRHAQLEEIGALLPQFEAALGAAVAEARSAVAAASAIAAAQTGVAPEQPLHPVLPPCPPGAAIEELRRLLAENNLAAAKQAQQLAQALAGAGLDAQIAEINEQMDKLDFRGAERTLAALSAEFGR